MLNKTNSNQIIIIIPLQKIEKDSPFYDLIITDAFGIEHYFDADGSYAGWASPDLSSEDEN